jgi:hypothetical protein
MPFNKDTAAVAGAKGGRATKTTEGVRNKQFSVSVTQTELDLIDQKRDTFGISRTELIVRAVKAYEPEAQGYNEQMYAATAHWHKKEDTE